MHLAPLLFRVQVKALADINSCTISVMFQMSETLFSLQRGRGKGWMGYTTGSALAATCKITVSVSFPENEVP